LGELAEAAAGGKSAPTNATRKARAELEDAESELNAATAALTKVRANLGDLEDAALDASNRVTAAVDVLLRASAAEQALSDAETLALRLRELTPLLRYLLDPRITPQNALSPRSPMFSLDWDHEARTLGRERASRRSFATPMRAVFVMRASRNWARPSRGSSNGRPTSTTVGTGTSTRDWKHGAPPGRRSTTTPTRRCRRSE
jgi:hypothetical protein